jgi:transcription elongation factor GreA
MTKEGFEKLREDLEHLQKVERPKVIKDIQEARAHGDLSENAEYDAARDRQAFIEKRIAELSQKIRKVQIVDTSKLSKEKVGFGSAVVLHDLNEKKEINYIITGEDELDPMQGKISVNSPIAQALLGKEKGDTVEVRVPAGIKKIKIKDIK